MYKHWSCFNYFGYCTLIYWTMAKTDKKIEFIADFSNNKKGEIKTFSNDIANIFVNRLKVAEFYTEKEVKTKTTNKKK